MVARNSNDLALWPCATLSAVRVYPPCILIVDIATPTTPSDLAQIAPHKAFKSEQKESRQESTL